MLGRPGAHTSMRVRRLATILPAMSLAEALETTRIHRVAGRTGARTAVVTSRPCCAPQHTIADVGLIGGDPVPRRGAVSRARHGMLFLDERPEFRRHVLEVLRQPLEECVIYLQSPASPQPHRARGPRHTHAAASRSARLTHVGPYRRSRLRPGHPSRTPIVADGGWGNATQRRPWQRPSAVWSSPRPQERERGLEHRGQRVRPASVWASCRGR